MLEDTEVVASSLEEERGRVFPPAFHIFDDGTEETDERGHVVTRGDVRGTLKEIPAGAAVVRIDMSSEGFARLRSVSCVRLKPGLEDTVPGQISTQDLKLVANTNVSVPLLSLVPHCW